MARVHHPRIAGISYEVPDRNVRTWVKAGWLADEADAPSDEPPKGNASREEWAEYAVRVGVEVTDEMTRDEIREAVPAD